MLGFARQIMTVGLVLPLGFGAIGAAPCFAQMGDGPTSLNAAAHRNLRGAQQSAKPGVAAPPVLPGTKNASEPAAATVSPADMSPTDGLFDAINRGDAAAARDAVNRGANMDGRNLLGLTPLELSVDLGRNDISFLLLSMRGEDASTRRPAQRDADRRGGESPRLVGRPRIAAAPARAPEETVVATPRLYSRDGGAPIPAAGFLGFDEGRSVR